MSSDDAAEISTPAKVAENTHRERHRAVFNEKAFGVDRDGNPLSASQPISRGKTKDITPSQWAEIVNVVSNWKTDAEVATLDGQGKKDWKALKAQFTQNKNAYRWVKEYTVERGTNVDGTEKLTLHRKEIEQQRVVVPLTKIFDAIDEFHRANGHLGQERTYIDASKKYYNVTQHLVKVYCETCRICNGKQPTIGPQKGAKRPILSKEFRDRFQVDLIDMRKMQRRNIYGIMQRWIVTVKDHFTGLTFVTSIPRKRPKYVAYELEKYFGLVGYPAIFHTDNGKEFTSKEIIEVLRQINPAILTVTGRPRTPRDQGSVESMNKLVKRVLQSIEDELRAEGLDPDWTRLLGRVTSSINNQRSRQANSTTSYSVVFGMSYHQNISCTMEEARKCYTIDQRLGLSRDDRLAAVAKEVCVLSASDGDVEKSEDDRNEGYWSDDSAMLDSDGEKETVNENPSTPEKQGIISKFEAALRDADPTLSEDDILTMVSNPKNHRDMALALDPELTKTCGNAVKEAIDMVDQKACASAAATALKAADPSTPLIDTSTSTKAPTPSSPKKVVDLTLAIPWGFKIRRNGKTYQGFNTCNVDTCLQALLYLRDHCDGLGIYFVLDKKLNQVLNLIENKKFDAARYEWIKHSQSEAQAAPVQISPGPRNSDVDEVWDCMGTLEDQLVAAKLFKLKTTDRFEDCSVGTFNCSNEHKYQDDNQWALREQNTDYLDVYADEMHDMQNKHFNVTHNSYTIEVPCGHGMRRKDRKGNECKGIRLLRKEITEEPGLLQIVAKRRVSQLSSSIKKVSTLTCIDKIEHTLLINGVSYELVQINLANGTPHFRGITLIDGNYLLFDGLGVGGKGSLRLQWVFSNFDFGTYFVYSLWYAPSTSRKKKPTELPTKTPTTPNDKPNAASDSSRGKDLALCLPVQTPLAIGANTAVARALSTAKRRAHKDEQATKMILAHGKQLADSGVAPGAVVTVQVDSRDVTHPRGIIGIVYQVKETGGALIVCEHGVLTAGNSKSEFWVASDRYVLRYKPDESANVSAALESIRTDITSETFDYDAHEKITICQAHQLRVGASSPCKKAGCGCKNGNCKGTCGCIRGSRGQKVACSSSCSCNGNCKANPLNECNKK